jgi:hypothetical protein
MMVKKSDENSLSLNETVGENYSPTSTAIHPLEMSEFGNVAKLVNMFPNSEIFQHKKRFCFIIFSPRYKFV